MRLPTTIGLEQVRRTRRARTTRAQLPALTTPERVLRVVLRCLSALFALAAPSEIDGIPLDHPTLGTIVKGQGYETALVGKWHCGFLPWFSPTRLGWDEFFGNFSGGLDYFSKFSHNGLYDLYEDEVEYEDVRYYTDIVTERAVEFVSREHDDPWLLNLNVTTPHWPWEGRGDKAVSDELTARLRSGDPRALFHDDGGSLEKYREMVEDLDDAVGKVLAALRRSGQLARLARKGVHDEPVSSHSPLPRTHGSRST